MPMPWKRSKKLSQPCGADPREACAWHTDRGVVPGRDAGRPEEQAHLSLGQEGLPSPRHARSTDRIDLLVRCGLPRTRDWRRPRTAGLQQRSHAAPSRRDRNQGHLGCPRDRPARSSRLAWHENAEGPKQHVVDATAAARTRTQRQFMRQNWLSNRVFKSFDDIVDHCCYGWNTLIDQPWKIMSVARRDWAIVGHSM